MGQQASEIVRYCDEVSSLQERVGQQASEIVRYSDEVSSLQEEVGLQVSEVARVRAVIAEDRAKHAKFNAVRHAVAACSQRALIKAHFLSRSSSPLELAREFLRYMKGRVSGAKLSPRAEVLPAGFDEIAYLAEYNDVCTAVALGELPSGLVHYVTLGLKEGRVLPLLSHRSAVLGNHDFADELDVRTGLVDCFDEQAYLLAHDDVRDAVAMGDFASGFAHYQLFGRDEGRVLARRPNLGNLSETDGSVPAGFDEHAYLTAHDDVRHAVAMGDFASGFAHYQLFGRDEGRVLARRPNLGNLSETDGSVPAGFDEHAYLTAHDDVRHAVAMGDFASGFTHYQLVGRDEGRSLSVAKLLNDLRSLLDLERSRIDWALGATEGITANINSYHILRSEKEYLAAFEKPEPLVSVCVATTNRVDILLRRAIFSLQNQTYKNLQIVVVGDACTDDTAQRLSALGDARITFVNLPERGPYPRPGVDRWRVAGSNAVNHALSLCNGDFVTHLDDDDMATTDRISSLVAAAKGARADFLWHPFWSENDKGTWDLLGDGRFELGNMTTGSIFYHNYFKRFLWDVYAYRLNEPGDWNRLRKIKLLRPRLHFVPVPLMYHFKENSQRAFVARTGERFLD